MSIDPLDPSDQDRIAAIADYDGKPVTGYTVEGVIVTDSDGYSLWVYTEAEGEEQGFGWHDDETHDHNGITWIIQEA